MRCLTLSVIVVCTLLAAHSRVSAQSYAANVDGQIHAVTIDKGEVRHGHFQQGGFSRWGDVNLEINAGNPGKATAIACTGIGKELFVVAIADNKLVYCVRLEDGFWKKWTEVKGETGDLGDLKGATLASAGTGKTMTVLVTRADQPVLILERNEDGAWKGGKAEKGIELKPKLPDPGLDPNLGLPAKKQGKSKIDGVWVIESVKLHGKSDEEGVGDAVHFADGKLNFAGDLRTFTLDETKSPMWWDWSRIPDPEAIGRPMPPPGPNGKSPMMPGAQEGIAKIENDKLYLAYNVTDFRIPPPRPGGPPPGLTPGRPTAFDSKNGIVIVLCRGDDDDLKRLTAKPEPEVDLLAKNKDKPAGKSKLDGYWVVVSSKYRGEAEPDSKEVLHFEKGVWKGRGGLNKFAVDESKNPMWIDFVRVPGDLGGGVPKLKSVFREPRWPDIFKIEKDTLHWAYTVDERPPFGPPDKSLTPRPRSFNSREGVFMVLRRGTIDDWKRMEAEPVVPGPMLPGIKKGPPGKDPGPGLPGIKPKKLPGKLSLFVPDNARVFMSAEVGHQPDLPQARELT